MKSTLALRRSQQKPAAGALERTRKHDSGALEEANTADGGT
jgi:hypothetical protein